MKMSIKAWCFFGGSMSGRARLINWLYLDTPFEMNLLS